MASLKSVRGLSWGASAISNATWTGVKLSDVLAYAGAKEEQVEHVHLQGKQIILILFSIFTQELFFFGAIFDLLTLCANSTIQPI